MNQLHDFPSRSAVQVDDQGNALLSYRPVHPSLAERVKKPAAVTGAMLGAAALGYLALLTKGRAKAKRPLSPQEAAHRLAAKPAPGMPAGRLPMAPPTGIARVAAPVIATPAGAAKAGSSVAPRHAKANAKAVRKQIRQQGTWRQLFNTGKSLMALFNAVAALKAAQNHVDPVPTPDAPHAGMPPPPTSVETLAATGLPADANASVKAEAATAVAPAASQPAFKPIPKGSFLTRSWHLIKAAVSSWVDDFAPSMGAALSYYTVFSLAPMLLIVIGVAGLIFGAEAARGEIVTQLRGLMGEQGAVAVEELLKSASDPGKGIFATIVGFVTLLVGATAVFAELQSSLDRIWRTPAPPNESGIWGIIRTRILSFGLILGLGFLMIVSLVLSAALAALGNWWGSYLGNWEFVLQALNFAVSFGVVTVLFAAIYKFMPHATIAWKNVWVGAIVTALLFTIGKFLIGLYIGKSGVASGFGAAGSFAVLLVWVYYSAQIFLLGAEFTWVYSHRNDPPPNAAPVPVRSDAGQATAATA
ncbi:YhjD/YihY/BrkB family envelope integrity protein [Noviherbaspirillum sp. L7-7A]|uniref:YihY/virulence factor BrkB family protein n=1 Tax=Noviherbaspirillum sp. L7-7A TaxID=2850560 RepID=UPI0032C494C8